MSRLTPAFVFCFPSLLGFSPPLAAQGPNNVLVVVNRSSPESTQIADYYIRRRAIPPANVCSIRAAPDETISRETYDKLVASPILDCLAKGDRRFSIHYIVTTKGVPMRISGTDGQSGTAAAVDSELTLLYSRLAGSPHKLEGVVPNPFYGKRDARFAPKIHSIYLVTRLAAYSVATVKKMIDRSLAATNRGRFVIDMREGSDEPGESWLRNTAVLLPQSRLVFNQDRQVLLKQNKVIAYAAWGSNDKNRQQRFLGFEWLPGAIAIEFVSTDGRTFLRPPDNWNIGPWESRTGYHAGSPQSMAADYLEEGATGVSGHVFEPYLGYTPNPELVLPAYYAGRNLADSFYLGMRGLSWMNIVVGDPLCSLGPPK
jgi:uncharacterized protein (TIGR03790 family)